MPFVTQVAAGRRDALSIFGNDYDTPDGTGLRDYIHVMDLAAGHVAALERLQREAGVLVVNLGTGQPYSVLDVVRTFERVNAQRVPHQIAPRRPGDIAACWADPGFAEHVLGWKSTRGLDDMCRDAWHWQSSNPMGYVYVDAIGPKV
jgi:UDP-glucose 4-epimerase